MGRGGGETGRRGRTESLLNTPPARFSVSTTPLCASHAPAHGTLTTRENGGFSSPWRPPDARAARSTSRPRRAVRCARRV